MFGSTFPQLPPLLGSTDDMFVQPEPLLVCADPILQPVSPCFHGNCPYTPAAAERSLRGSTRWLATPGNSLRYAWPSAVRSPALGNMASRARWVENAST